LKSDTFVPIDRYRGNYLKTDGQLVQSISTMDMRRARHAVPDVQGERLAEGFHAPVDDKGPPH
jgi:hypothetical protein